jgi:CheY-like chemotaxis protein
VGSPGAVAGLQERFVVAFALIGVGNREVRHGSVERIDLPEVASIPRGERLVSLGSGQTLARSGLIDMRAQAEVPSALRADTPMEATSADVSGMSGYDVARHLYHHHGAKRPLLIAVTGQAGARDRQQFEEAGIDLHLVKPVDPVQLNDVLRRFERIIFPLPPESD